MKSKKLTYVLKGFNAEGAHVMSEKTTTKKAAEASKSKYKDRKDITKLTITKI